MDLPSAIKRLVADSSALILLAKCSILETVCNLFEVIVPDAVRAETATDEMASKHPDAALILDLIVRGLIKVGRPRRKKLPLPLTLHRGETDELLLSAETRDCLFACDDGKAIKAARFLSIPFIISPRIAVDLFRSGKISADKARKSIEILGTIGRYSPDIMAEAIFSLTEAKNGKTDYHKNTGRPPERD